MIFVSEETVEEVLGEGDITTTIQRLSEANSDEVGRITVALGEKVFMVLETRKSNLKLKLVSDLDEYIDDIGKKPKKKKSRKKRK